MRRGVSHSLASVLLICGAACGADGGVRANARGTPAVTVRDMATMTDAEIESVARSVIEADSELQRLFGPPPFPLDETQSGPMFLDDPSPERRPAGWSFTLSPATPLTDRSIWHHVACIDREHVVANVPVQFRNLVELNVTVDVGVGKIIHSNWVPQPLPPRGSPPVPTTEATTGDVESTSTWRGWSCRPSTDSGD